MHKFNKKAFTMVEMLVCVLCIGILTVALGSFVTSINNATLKLRYQEDELLKEYSDISRLESATITPEFIETLNNPEFLSEATHLLVGNMHLIPFDTQNLVSISFESNDESIVVVDESGTCFPIGSGITFIKIKAVLADNSNIESVYPIVVDDVETPSYTYYFYHGKKYTTWFIREA
jgi:type II secretory pathway pseudopilin PulG